MLSEADHARLCTTWTLQLSALLLSLSRETASTTQCLCVERQCISPIAMLPSTCSPLFDQVAVFLRNSPCSWREAAIRSGIALNVCRLPIDGVCAPAPGSHLAVRPFSGRCSAALLAWCYFRHFKSSFQSSSSRSLPVYRPIVLACSGASPSPASCGVVGDRDGWSAAMLLGRVSPKNFPRFISICRRPHCRAARGVWLCPRGVAREG